MKLVVAVAALFAAALPQAPAGSFVTQSGTHLLLGGAPFRFGGANIEWLGVAGYGPADPAGPHYPSHYEVDDALATARELGATVVRSQTMGDSVGCETCIEPALGQFNDAAFAHTDYALASARAHGLKIIATIVGDDALEGGSGCVYLRWRNIAPPDCSLINMAAFWTDPTVIGDVEEHIAAVLNHVNVYTHVAYKDDPTILGWDLMNGGGSPSTGRARSSASYAGSIAPSDPVGGANAGPRGRRRLRLVRLPALVAAVRVPPPRVRGVRERTSRSSPTSTAGTRRTSRPAQRSRIPRHARRDPEVAGDAFWALAGASRRARVDAGPGRHDRPGRGAKGESGEWWALYYPGVRTLVSTRTTWPRVPR